MSKFIIRTHGRLQEWVAEEKGYFKEERLDYIFDVKPSMYWSASVTSTDEAPDDYRQGAFESYEEGRGCDVSTACHWTVNYAAASGHGRMWGNAYSVCPSGIWVPPESDVMKPEDLADTEISVGYHSGSHYSTIQGMLKFMDRDRIKLRFGGGLYDRLGLLIDRKTPAANAFGVSYYTLEQLGFRKVMDTTFMMGALIDEKTPTADVEKFYRALKRAQQDIDASPEKYVHYFMNELPQRFHQYVDYRRFGPGERLVFLPYTQEIFEQTHKWVEDMNLFPDRQGVRNYGEAIVSSAAE